MSNLNFVDLIILALFAFSVLSGLIRGLLKELISLLTWIAACVIASLFSSKLAAYFSGSTDSLQNSITSTAGIANSATVSQTTSMFSIGASFIVLFIVTLLVGSIVNFLITRAAVGQFSLMNRLLGALFGAVRGVVIITVGIFIVQLTPVATQGFWTASKFVAQAQPAVTWFSGLVSPGLEALKSKAEEAVQNTNSDVQQGASSLFQDQDVSK